MISVSIGSHRFESGPNYHYNASTAESLKEVVLHPEQVTNYVNMLPDVNATTEEIQQVAAAGLVLLAVGNADTTLLPETSEVLLDVCRGETGRISKELFAHPRSWSDRSRLSGSLTNTLLDSASVLATRENKPEETAGIIERDMKTNDGYFMIGLANGAAISAARTFLQLGQGNHALSFVRYSRNKSEDKEPYMHPYPEQRKDWLRRLAKDRQVVVYDEDYASRKTLQTAVQYFARLFENPVYGIAPVHVGRRISYAPLVIASD